MPLNAKFEIHNDDCLLTLKTLPDDSIHSLVTDPPAGIGFSGQAWDSDRGGRDQWVSWLQAIMTECHRVLKPGAFGLVWALPRTSHWTTLALENSGFLIKDKITHIFGTGFPKSMAVDKMITKAKIIDLPTVHTVTQWIRQRKIELGLTNYDLNKLTSTVGAAVHWTAKNGSQRGQIPSRKNWDILKRALGRPPEHIESIVYKYHNKRLDTEDRSQIARKWKGFGTGIKPAHEEWILVQKPISTRGIAENIMIHGCGALNIDACRVHTTEVIQHRKLVNFKRSEFFGATASEAARASCYRPHEDGRFPSNIMTSGYFDVNDIKSLKVKNSTHRFFKNFEADTRPIYCPKAGAGGTALKNTHPTKKSLDLMRYLTALVTPSEGNVLDPFMGSGTTGVAALENGFCFVGMEENQKYFSLAKQRILDAKKL